MPLHNTTFTYLKPSAGQLATMDQLRQAAHIYAAVLDSYLPDGPDKTYTLRKLREVAMWANVAITRQADGQPRGDGPHNPAAEYPAGHPAPGDLGSVPL